MRKIQFTSVAHENEKKYGLYYTLSNYKRDQVKELIFNPKNKIGDVDLHLKLWDFQIELIQIKSRPDTKNSWSIIQKDFIKGICQLFVIFIDHTSIEDLKYSYTLILEGGAVTNEYGNFLKDLKNNVFRKGDIRKIHEVIKEDVINFIKKNQEKKTINLEMDSINSLLLDFLGEVKIILNYNDQLINFHLKTTVPSLESIFFNLSNSFQLDSESLDKLFESNNKSVVKSHLIDYETLLLYTNNDLQKANKIVSVLIDNKIPRINILYSDLKLIVFGIIIGIIVGYLLFIGDM